MSYRDLRKAEKRLQDAEARLAKRGVDPWARWEREGRALAASWRAPTGSRWGDVGYNGQVLTDPGYGTDPALKAGHNTVVTLEEHQLVLEHMPLVKEWARRFAGRTRGTVYEDLVHIGQDELYKQLPRWDRTSGITFGAFVRKRVRGAMANYLDAERNQSMRNLSFTSFEDDEGRPADDFTWVKYPERDAKRYRGKQPKAGPSSYAVAASWRERGEAAEWCRETVTITEAVEQALATLTENQRAVYRARVMQDPPVEVSVLAKRLGVIERRIRALEARPREVVSVRLKEIGK
jgi:RNA polymerase sigma factor (sigma-70 family)